MVAEPATGELLPYRIDVPEVQLTDLSRRLRATRWPDRETVTDWSQGVRLHELRQLCEHWASRYDWRATERRLNRWPQFTRLHLESIAQASRWFTGPADTIDVPTGCTVFPREVPHPSRRQAERRFTHIVHWGEPERGGHFGAWERPQLFAREVRAVRRALHL